MIAAHAGCRGSLAVWTMSNWSLLTLLKTTVLSGIILLISGSMTARADWRVQLSTDAITDREEKIAEVHNQRGYRFGVYRVEGGQVFAVFALPSSLVGSIDHDRSMHLRIDKNKPHERGGPFAREWEKLGGEKTFYWEPGFVKFLAWHGEQESGISRIINELMAGDQLLVRYPVGTGGARDTSFSLSGSKPAITEALNLSDDPAVKARQIKAEKYNSLVGESSQGCRATDAPDYACFRKIVDCVRSHPSPNWQRLQRCLTQ